MPTATFAVMANSRDELIDAKALALVNSKHNGWHIGAAREFAASLPKAPADAPLAGATCNGWPVITRNGVRISLQLAADVGGGSVRFAKPGKLD